MLNILNITGNIVVGGIAAWLLIQLFTKNGKQMGRRSQQMTCMGLCAFLIVLAGCGSTQSNTSKHTNTPVAKRAVTPTVVPTPIATQAALDSEDWPTYHHDNTRTGYLPNEPDPKQLTKAWTAALDGAVYAEPLVVKGHVIVATENDTLYALDPATGNVQWHTNVGTPVQQSTLPCGNIDPLGITGTPVYDPATGLVFAVAEVSGPHHILVGVDVNTGNLRVNLPVDVAGMNPTKVYQQRAALLLSQDVVYIAYGGLAGDCGNYRGLVVAAHTNGQGTLLSYQVPTPREGGIWAPSGPALDANGDVYVSVGNGEITSGDWDHSDAVLRLSPTLQLQDGFAPGSWQEENSHDTDLGSMGPTLLANNLIFIAGKSGHGYLLHANALGGVGGQVADAQICNGLAMGGTATAGSQIFVPCTDGLRKVTVGSDTQLQVNWHVAPSLPPIIGGHTVYNLDSGGTLHAFATDTGTQRAQINLAVGLPHFATPTISAGHIFVPTTSGVVAVTIS